MENSCEAAQDLKKIQSLLLEALIEIDRLCRATNLRYYMVSGTLLGAARHRGFIPWDSDVDIAMFREDFERFVMLNDQIDPRFFIQSDHSDPRCGISFARVRVNGTRTTPRGNQPASGHCGFFVDVFVLDDMPRTPTLVDLADATMVNLLQRVKAYRFGKRRSVHLRNTIAAALAAVLTCCIPTQTIKNLIRSRVTRHNGGGAEYVTNYLCPSGMRKQTMPKAVYGEPVELEFEGKMFLAPCQYESWLRQVYGDYLTLPPVEERTAHLDLLDYDLGPYGD